MVYDSYVEENNANPTSSQHKPNANSTQAQHINSVLHTWQGMHRHTCSIVAMQKRQGSKWHRQSRVRDQRKQSRQSNQGKTTRLSDQSKQSNKTRQGR